MEDSEIDSPTPLERMVARSLPDGVEGRFRPHPRAQVVRKAYLPRCDAKTLAEAVEGARFAVMINSNAGNECLALGCPVLCLGPALYEKAGVALRTTQRTFYREFGQMLDGWKPDAERVRNYLHWLACRQYSPDDFRDSQVLSDVVRRAVA